MKIHYPAHHVCSSRRRHACIPRPIIDPTTTCSRNRQLLQRIFLSHQEAHDGTGLLSPTKIQPASEPRVFTRQQCAQRQRVICIASMTSVLALDQCTGCKRFISLRLPSFHTPPIGNNHVIAVPPPCSRTRILIGLYLALIPCAHSIIVSFPPPEAPPEILASLLLESRLQARTSAIIQCSRTE